MRRPRPVASAEEKPVPGRRGTAALLVCGLFWSAVAAAQPETSLLTLAEALDLAARNNETAAIAQARLDRARALRREAYATLLPEVTVTGTYTRRAREVTREIDGESVVIQARDALAGNATVDVALFDARTLPVARAATRSLHAQEFLSFDLRRALAFDVAESYFAVLSAERLRDAATRRIGVAEATVADAETKLEAGLASRNELTRVQLELATARLARTEAENSVRTNRLLLGFLIGAPAERPLAEPEPSLLAEATPEEMEREAERLRPDLQAAALRAEALRLLAQEPLLRMVPTLDLQGIYRGTNEAGLSGNDTDWNVAATLTWEVFDGGVRYAQAAARRAEFREASLATDQLRRLIGQEIRTARADLDTAHAALEQAQVRARVAEQNAEEVRVRFGEGLATGLEQADAVVSAFEAEAELARQRFALRLAELFLLRSAGRWPSATPPAGPVPTASEPADAP
jgi:outer membrane protein TolC